MLGIQFVKTQPTTYLMEFKGGKVVREGAGLSFFYYAPTTSLVAVPIGSQVNDFIFELVTADFQAVTIQGQITYRIGDPNRIAGMLNFSLRSDGKTYESDDPEKLPRRIIASVEVLTQKWLKNLALKEALRSSDTIAEQAATSLRDYSEIQALGVEILGLSVVSVKPTPETARALEAEAREAILKAADDAIFLRRNAAVENERAIRESELDTEIAVELKKRQIKETQMEAEASLQHKKAELRKADLAAEIDLEESRKSFVEKQAMNSRTLAEAEAHRLAAIMKALDSTDPRIIQAFVAAGMQPSQLIAQAFGGIADKAERIGNLNMSPELLSSLMQPINTPEEPIRGKHA